MRGEKRRVRFVPRRTAGLPSDTEGSYTGIPIPPDPQKDCDPVPVQDADDL